LVMWHFPRAATDGCVRFRQLPSHCGDTATCIVSLAPQRTALVQVAVTDAGQTRSGRDAQASARPHPNGSRIPVCDPKTWRRGVSIARRHKFAAVNGKVMLELWSIISVLNPHHHVYVIIRLRDHKIVR
jgi:hypothetical protein